MQSDCETHMFSLMMSNEPEHDETNKMTCVPSKDLVQPVPMPSLIRVFAVCFMGG